VLKLIEEQYLNPATILFNKNYETGKMLQEAECQEIPVPEEEGTEN